MSFAEELVQIWYERLRFRFPFLWPSRGQVSYFQPNIRVSPGSFHYIMIAANQCMLDETTGSHLVQRQILF